jgi:Flp pilus assembly pilin Flp
MNMLRSAQSRSKTLALQLDERGLSTVEYVIILVLIAVTAIGIWKTFGNTIVNKITNANTTVDTQLKW